MSEAQLRGLAAQQVGGFTRVYGTAYQPCQIGPAVSALYILLTYILNYLLYTVHIVNYPSLQI